MQYRTKTGFTTRYILHRCKWPSPTELESICWSAKYIDSARSKKPLANTQTADGCHIPILATSWSHQPEAHFSLEWWRLVGNHHFPRIDDDTTRTHQPQHRLAAKKQSYVVYDQLRSCHLVQNVNTTNLLQRPRLESYPRRCRRCRLRHQRQSPPSLTRSRWLL